MTELCARQGIPRQRGTVRWPVTSKQAGRAWRSAAVRRAAIRTKLRRIQPAHPEQNGRHERMHLDPAAGPCLLPVLRGCGAALVTDYGAAQLSLLPVTASTPFRGREVFDHFRRRQVPNAVTDVTSGAFSSYEKDQIGKLTQNSNWCLQFFSFICYKQSTESRSVAAGRSLFETLVSVRHLRFKRVKSLQSSRPRDLIRKHLVGF